MNDGGFHLNLVAMEDRQYEVCANVSHDWNYRKRAQVGIEHRVQVAFLAEIIVGEVGVIVYMTEAVHIVETNLNIGLVLEMGLNKFFFHSFIGIMPQN